MVVCADRPPHPTLTSPEQIFIILASSRALIFTDHPPPRYPAAEMKHGPIALIDRLMPVVCIAPKRDPFYEKVYSNIMEVPSARLRLRVICVEVSKPVGNIHSPSFPYNEYAFAATETSLKSQRHVLFGTEAFPAKSISGSHLVRASRRCLSSADSHAIDSCSLPLKFGKSVERKAPSGHPRRLSNRNFESYWTKG